MDIFNVVQAAQFLECANCGMKSLELCQCPCKAVFYCGTNCQYQHWAVHKPRCAARHHQSSLSACLNCGETSQLLKSCPCGSALYCGVTCQRQHWGVHRRMCSNWITTFQRSKPRMTQSSAQTDVTCQERLTAEQASLKRRLGTAQRARNEAPTDSGKDGIVGDMRATSILGEDVGERTSEEDRRAD